MSGFGDLRALIVSTLAAGLPVDTYQIESGRLDGGPLDRNLICVFPSGHAEGQEVDFANLFFVVRVFRWEGSARSTDPYTPVSPVPLEDVVDQIANVLEAVQSAQGGVWFFRMTESRFDLSRFFVDVEVRAFAENVFRSV